MGINRSSRHGSSNAGAPDEMSKVNSRHGDNFLRNYESTQIEQDFGRDADQTTVFVDDMDRVESQLQMMIKKNNELENLIYMLTEENVKLKNVQGSLL